jgi:hypothetical protein
MGRTCSIHEITALNILVRKPEGKRPSRRPGHKAEGIVISK